MGARPNDAGDSRSTYGAVTATWSVIDAVTGAPIVCQVFGADLFVLTISIGSKDVVKAGHSCDDITSNAGSGLIPGSYYATGELTTRDGAVIAGLDGGMFEVRAGENTVLPQFVFAIHGFRFPWTITKAGTPSSCDAVGAQTVDVSWTGSYAGLAVDTPCTSGMSGMVPIVGGPYLLQATLLDAASKTLATWKLQPWNVVDRGAQAPPTITFDIP